MVDVPDVEFDALGPRQAGPAVDLRPAGDAGRDVETPRLMGRVLVDLIAQRRPGADEAHLADEDVPELRQLVDRRLAQQLTDLQDARVAGVDGEARALRLGVHDHRAQLEHVERRAV